MFKFIDTINKIFYWQENGIYFNLVFLFCAKQRMIFFYMCYQGFLCFPSIKNIVYSILKLWFENWFVLHIDFEYIFWLISPVKNFRHQNSVEKDNSCIKKLNFDFRYVLVLIYLKSYSKIVLHHLPLNNIINYQWCKLQLQCRIPIANVEYLDDFQ